MVNFLLFFKSILRLLLLKTPKRRILVALCHHMQYSSRSNEQLFKNDFLDVENSNSSHRRHKEERKQRMKVNEDNRQKKQMQSGGLKSLATMT